tara:strand:+ start:262 stop:435 length:174 start_codon:yes stop_codon:yes gene_type:complete
MEKKYLKKRMVVTLISGDTYLTIVAMAVKVNISRMQVAIPKGILSFVELDDIQELSM